MPLFHALKREFASDFFIRDTSTSDFLKNPMARPDVSLTAHHMVCVS